MKFFTATLVFLLLTSSLVLSAIGNDYEVTNHMTPTPSAVITTPIPTITKGEYYASPSYNISYGIPAPILQTPNTWHDVIYGISFMIIGLVEVFYGYKLIRATLFVMGFLFWSSTSVMILLVVDSANQTPKSSLFYFAIWLGSGLLGGLLSYWCWHLGLMLSSAYGGFAFIITILTLSHISNDILRYVMITIFVLFPPIVVHRFERHVINIATSIAGSYTFFYGVDEFAHQGYSEMIQLIRSDGTLRFKPTAAVYVMIVFTLLLAALGIAYEHIYHETPCNNSWCGDKHRRRGKHSDDVNHQDHLRDFGNSLLSKIINLFKIIKLRSSNLFLNNNNNNKKEEEEKKGEKEVVNQAVNNTSDNNNTHVINVVS